MTLAEIQHAIEELPEDLQTALATWVADLDRTHWDEQIERDFSPGGSGMELLQSVKDKVEKGESRLFSESCRRS